MKSLSPALALATQFVILAVSGLFAFQTSRPLLRALLLATIWFFGISAFNTFPKVANNVSFVASAIGLFVLVWILHLTQVICVENYVVPRRETPAPWLTAYKMLFDVRRTASAAKLAPNPKPQRETAAATSDGRPSTEGKKPNLQHHARAPHDQLHFRNIRVVKVVLLATLYWSYLRAIPIIVAPILPDAVSVWQSKRSIFLYSSHQLFSDFIFRALLVSDFILTTYTIDTIFHSLFALLFVSALGFDSPEEWPALWGSIFETTSIRNFWAKFWHRLVQRTLLGLSSYLLSAIGIRPRGSAGKVLISFLVFFFSGVAHAFTTWRLGFRCGWWGDMGWFCAQFVAISLEDVVIVSLKKVMGRKLKTIPNSILTVVGYIWTWGFLLWSIPKMEYVKMECGIELK